MFTSRNIVRSVVLVTASVFLFSCEDVVDVQTADAPKQVVVDAWLNNQPTSQQLRITYSQPYFNSDFAEPLTGATVQVVASSGKSFNFVEMDPGTYVWKGENGETLGEPGDQFELSINLADQILTATSVMNPVTMIDSISQEFRENDLSGPDGIYAQFYARDIAGLGNAYWIKTFKNDQFLNKPEEINLAFDAGFDGGSQLDGLIFIPPIRELINPIPDEFPADEAPYKEGDQIRVEIHSLTLEAFEFMSMVRDQILNGSNTIFASPIANSKGNIKSQGSDVEALGIFCVSAISSAEKTVE